MRSILALAIVATSVTANLSPARAVTWEEALDFVKRGLGGNTQSSPQQQPSDSGEASQPAEDGDSTPQPQLTSDNNSQADSTPIQGSLKCVEVHGRSFEGIGEGEHDSTVSVGLNAIKAYGRSNIGYGDLYQMTCPIGGHSVSKTRYFNYAIPDNSGLGSARITLYLDGQVKISKVISRGQVGRYSLDITGASSYAYRVEPIDGWGNIYLVQ